MQLASCVMVKGGAKGCDLCDLVGYGVQLHDRLEESVARVTVYRQTLVVLTFVVTLHRAFMQRET